MNNYPAPRINQALGIDPGASLDDALTAIAQLRASVADAHNWSPAFQRMAEFLYAMAGPQLARAPATPFTPAGLEQLCELTSAAVSDRVRELRQTLHGLQHDRDALRAELKQADEALADTQRDLETARAAHQFAERMAETLYGIATEGPPAPPWPSVAWSRERIEVLCEEASRRAVKLESDLAILREATDTMAREGHDAYQEKLRLLSELGEARRSVSRFCEDEQRYRAELKQANEALADTQRDLETARAAHRFAERMQRERDTAYAVLHHLTAEYAP